MNFCSYVSIKQLNYPVSNIYIIKTCLKIIQYVVACSLLFDPFRATAGDWWLALALLFDQPHTCLGAMPRSPFEQVAFHAYLVHIFGIFGHILHYVLRIRTEKLKHAHFANKIKINAEFFWKKCRDLICNIT